jgi:probable HAF family extracellular repeat protein
MSLRTIIGCTAACCLLLLCSGTAPAADFIGLSWMGADTNVRGVSGDGTFAVGQGGDALRWTSTGDALNLGDLPGNCCSFAIAASLNGSVVVGRSENGSDREAFRWTEGGGMLGLGVLPGYTKSQADAVSADGSIVVGHNYTGDGMLPDPHEAFLWTEGVGMVGLGTLPGDEFSVAHGVSADGSAVVGSSAHSTPTRFVWEAFRWTENGGMQGLGTLPGGAFGESDAYDISADGLTVVGIGDSAQGFEAFRWTAGTGMVGLGDLPGGEFRSRAHGVSADGSVVVGEAHTSAGREAFVWDETNGMRSVKDVLTAAGLDMTGWTLSIAWDVSDDGNAIVGRGDNPEQAWLARLNPVPEPGTGALLVTALMGLGVVRRR